MISEWQVENLSIGNRLTNTGFIQDPRIIKEIQDIHFSHLTSLFLVKDRIESIEGMNRIWMPMLKNLDLSNNINVKI